MKWTKKDKNGQNEQKWTKMDKNGQNEQKWTKMDQKYGLKLLNSVTP